ncbi:type II secretion system major pseudopilin GspG [bacterium]|nr:type II secretion system major pseudopilin GspG [bacterium]
MKGLKSVGNRRGFTLVELLVVVTILGILVAVVGVNVLRYPDKARRSAAKAQIAQFKSALDSFYLDTGTYPTNDEGLKALVEAPMDADISADWDGSYLAEARVPKDPWRHEYVYRQPGEDGTDFDIICYGKDGVEGGEGVDKDITNHNLDER